LLAADLMRDVRRRPARHLLAVNRRRQVELHVVAHRGRTLDRLERREALAERVDLLVDLTVGDL
jgi:hypothetical protein